MAYRVHFGAERYVELPELPSVWQAEPPGATAQQVSDLEAAIRQALEGPLGLPALSECLTGDDTVVLAIRRGTPCSDQIISTVVQVVLDRLTPSQPVTILRTEADAAAERADPRRLLRPEHARRVIIKTHQARNSEDLAYLARFEDGRVLRLNRSLVEADVVIPIGWTQSRGTWNRYSAFGAIFPAFADHTAQQRHWREVVERVRYRKLKRAGKVRNSLFRAASSLSREADWLLGTLFALEAVPGPLGRVLRVMAGDVHRVAKESREEFLRQWGLPVERRSDVVIAGVDHNPAHSAWENLAQAAWAAARLVNPRGQIILLADWETPGKSSPGVGLSPSEVAARGSWTDVLQELGDAIVPYWLLSRVRRRASLCVWSPQPVSQSLWREWIDWLGIETSSRPAVLEQWVRSSGTVTLLSHATLVCPQRLSPPPHVPERSA